MYVVKLLSFNPLLFDDSLKKWTGRELFFSRYDLLNMQSRAHQDCPDALTTIDVRPAAIEEYLGQELHPADSVVFVRTGGAGDVMMIMPLIQRIKKAMPSIRIGLATRKKFIELGVMSPYIDEVLTIPAAAEAVEKYDYVAQFYDAIEFPWTPARTLHGCNVFARRIGLPDLTREEMRVELVPPKGSVSQITHRLKKAGIKPTDRILLYQFKSSNVNRTYPPVKSAQLVYALSMLDPSVHVIITGGRTDCQMEWRGPDNRPLSRIHNWAGHTDLYDMAALAQRASLCIAPDSFLAHLGGAMGVPTLGLFNAVRPEMRIGQYDNVASLFTPYPCAPCFCHGPNPCSKCAILIKDWAARDKKDEPKPGAPCWQAITNRDICRMAAQLMGMEGHDA